VRPLNTILVPSGRIQVIVSNAVSDDVKVEFDLVSEKVRTLSKDSNDDMAG
jgi:hypothetical protein